MVCNFSICSVHLWDSGYESARIWVLIFDESILVLNVLVFSSNSGFLLFAGSSYGFESNKGSIYITIYVWNRLKNWKITWNALFCLSSVLFKCHRVNKTWDGELGEEVGGLQPWKNCEMTKIPFIGFCSVVQCTIRLLKYEIYAIILTLASFTRNRLVLSFFLLIMRFRFAWHCPILDMIF